MTQTPLAKAPPAPSPLPRLAFGAPASEVRQAIVDTGGVILSNVLSSHQVSDINADLDPMMSGWSPGRYGVEADKGNFIPDFMGHKTKRLVHVVRHSKVYREAYVGNPIMAEYIAEMIPGAPGNHSLGASQAIEIHPGEKAQVLHRDAALMLSLLGRSEAGDKEFFMNTLLALTDVTEEMGATRIVPGSHKWPDFSRKATQQDTVPALLNAGDVLFYSGLLLHGGGANVTKDRPRRVISTAFAISFFMGEEAWPFVIPLEEARAYPSQVQRYLGFRSVSFAGEKPGFLWRAETLPLEDALALN